MFLSLLKRSCKLYKCNSAQVCDSGRKNKVYNLKLLSGSFGGLRMYSVKCWQCGIERKNIGELFCGECHFIQNPMGNDNYFKMFELREDFEVNLKNLTQKYRKMQSLLHPDKFTTKSDQEKGISADYSSLVNKAYKTLQTPLSRAIHLLHIKGGKIEENQKIQDPKFLMEIMELNEQVENANTEEKLKKLDVQNKQELVKIGKHISEAFRRNRIDLAKANIVRMKYYTSISKHINGLMREKGIVD